MDDGIEQYEIPAGKTHCDVLDSVECDEWQYAPGSPEVIDSKFQGRIVAGNFLIRRGQMWSWGKVWDEGDTDRHVTVFWRDARRADLAAVAWQEIRENKNAIAVQVAEEMAMEEPGNIYRSQILREAQETQRDLAARRREWN